MHQQQHTEAEDYEYSYSEEEDLRQDVAAVDMRIPISQYNNPTPGTIQSIHSQSQRTQPQQYSNQYQEYDYNPYPPIPTTQQQQLLRGIQNIDLRTGEPTSKNTNSNSNSNSPRNGTMDDEDEIISNMDSVQNATDTKHHKIAGQQRRQSARQQTQTQTQTQTQAGSGGGGGRGRIQVIENRNTAGLLGDTTAARNASGVSLASQASSRFVQSVLISELEHYSCFGTFYRLMCFSRFGIKFTIIINILMVVLNSALIAYETFLILRDRSLTRARLPLWYMVLDFAITAILLCEIMFTCGAAHNCQPLEYMRGGWHNFVDMFVFLLSALCCGAYVLDITSIDIDNLAMLFIRVLRDVIRILRCLWFFRMLYANFIRLEQRPPRKSSVSTSSILSGPTSLLSHYRYEAQRDRERSSQSDKRHSAGDADGDDGQCDGEENRQIFMFSEHAKYQNEQEQQQIHQQQQQQQQQRARDQMLSNRDCRINNQSFKSQVSQVSHQSQASQNKSVDHKAYSMSSAPNNI